MSTIPCSGTHDWNTGLRWLRLRTLGKNVTLKMQMSHDIIKEPTSLKVPDPIGQPVRDHDQIIEQVLGLENDYGSPSGAMTNAYDNDGMVIGQQSQHQLLSDTNLYNIQSGTDGGRLSSSSEDILNLLSEFDSDSSISGSQQLDQDEKVGVETIKKQLMSCEVQSDQLLHQNTNSMSPVLNQLNSGLSEHARMMQQSRPPAIQIIRQQQVTQQQHLISQAAPVMSPHMPPQHQLSTSGLSQQTRQQQLPQQHRLSVDQNSLHGPYSSAHIAATGIRAVPVSSSGQPYSLQQHQNLSRISQSPPMSIYNNSPSPSWQQPQLSPFSPQNQHNDPSRPPSQRQQHSTMQQSHPLQSQRQHQTTFTSPEMQQLHHPLQRRSPSQSISPPATTEPSEIILKNPLLNALLDKK